MLILVRHRFSSGEGIVVFSADSHFDPCFEKDELVEDNFGFDICYFTVNGYNFEWCSSTAGITTYRIQPKLTLPLGTTLGLIQLGADAAKPDRNYYEAVAKSIVVQYPQSAVNIFCPPDWIRENSYED